jgi:hypothetical protein
MKFEPGQSGNPAGRPSGTFSFRTAIKQHLRENPQDGPVIVQAQIDKAKAGDNDSFKAIRDWIEPALPKQIDVNQLTPEQAIEILSLMGLSEEES